MFFYLNLLVACLVELFYLSCYFISDISVLFTLGFRYFLNSIQNKFIPFKSLISKAKMEINRNRKNCDLSQMEIMEAESIPNGRSGHQLMIFGDNIYSVGGYNSNCVYDPILKEVFSCNLVTRKWTKVKTTGTMPSELASHSANLCGNVILVFGGTGMPFGEKLSNKLHSLNLDTLKWSQPSCTGSPPDPVYGCSFTRHQNIIYTFGGTTGYTYSNKMHSLNLKTMVWTEVHPVNTNSIGVPFPRYRHEMIYHEGQLFLFGGGKTMIVYDFSKLQVFDIDESKWKIYDSKADPDHGFPQARRCHSCIKYGDFAYMLGGYDGENSFSDIWYVNLQTLQWTRMSTDLPECLYFHTADVSEEGQVVVYGGVRDDGARNSLLYSFWIEPPSLQTTCWQTLYNTMDKDVITSKNQEYLLDIGVPRHLLKNI